MNAPARDVAASLAADLAWLCDHAEGRPPARGAPGDSTLPLRLASALVRNVLTPALDAPPPTPLHLAVVGGAGAGKSTVANFLVGSVAVVANPQAGYTRHPTALVPAGRAANWPATPGFLGPLRRAEEPRPADADEDIYQVVSVGPPGAGAPDPLAGVVVWDCPDMTTAAAEHYVNRLIEVVALADVVAYVASDERYNDEAPTRFFEQVARAGKAAFVVLTKASPADADALVANLRAAVLKPLPGGDSITVVAVPGLDPATQRDPAGLGRPHRVALVNAVLALAGDPAAARGRTVRNALSYLDIALGQLLSGARADLAEVEAWRTLVDAGRAEFEGRYAREFLAGERFGRFDRTRADVLALLDWPPPLAWLSAALRFTRAPALWLRDRFLQLVKRPELPPQSERAVATAALAAWLDGLQAEALRRAGGHPVWRRIATDFDAVRAQSGERFGAAFRDFELKETDDLDRAAGAVPEMLSASPAALFAARLGSTALDLAAAGLTVAFAYPAGFWLIVLVPAALGASRQAVELAVGGAVEAGRAKARWSRQSLASAHLATPVAEWLADAPATGGSDLDRLRQISRRLPESISRLKAALVTPAGGQP